MIRRKERSNRCLRLGCITAGIALSIWGAALETAQAQPQAPQQAQPQAPQQPQTSGIEAQAVTPVTDDLARTRARTLNDAMARVLEQAVNLAAPELRGRLYLLTPRARDYLPTYRILEEGEAEGQFRIRILAEVDLPRLLRDLQAGLSMTSGTSRKPGARRVLVCATADAPAGQAALDVARALLGERGETVENLAADRCPSDPIQPSDALLATVRGAAAVLVWAAIGGEPPPRAEPIRGTQPPQLGARARGRWLSYRLPIAAATQPLTPSVELADATAFAESEGRATEQAVRTAATTALKLLLERQRLLASGPPGVTVNVEGLGSYATYTQMLQVLGALPGVSRAEPRRFLPKPPGSSEDDRVQIFVHTGPDTTAESLGAALGRTPVRGVQLQVMPLGPGELRVLCATSSQLPAAESPQAPEAAPDAAPTGSQTP